MSDTLDNLPARLAKQPIQGKITKPRPKNTGLTAKVKRAIEAMIWEGMARPEAAADAGLADVSLRQALNKPMVLAFYNAQLKVRRESTRARNLDRLEEIRDQNENYGAAVRAIQVLEGHGEQGRPGVSVSVNITPGYVMAPPDRAQVMDGEWQRSTQPQLPGAKPLSDIEDVG